jgi:hypothetical protein
MGSELPGARKRRLLTPKASMKMKEDIACPGHDLIGYETELTFPQLDTFPICIANSSASLGQGSHRIVATTGQSSVLAARSCEDATYPF